MPAPTQPLLRCWGNVQTLLGVENSPDAVRPVPAAACRRLGIFGGALFEEIGVLDAIQDLDQPGQWLRALSNRSAIPARL